MKIKVRYIGKNQHQNTTEVDEDIAKELVESGSHEYVKDRNKGFGPAKEPIKQIKKTYIRKDE